MLSGAKWLAGAAGIAALLVMAAPAMGQGMQGQFFFPNGQVAQEIFQFRLESDDPARPSDTKFTTPSGKFYLSDVGERYVYRIVVRSDGKRYGDTVVSFTKNSQPWLAVHLAALATAATASSEYDKGVAALRAGNRSQARKQFQRAIAMEDGFVDAYNDLAVLSMEDRKYAEAEQLLRKALKTDPKAVYPLLNLGKTLNHLGRHDEAIEPLRNVLKSHPEWSEAKTQLGIALLETEKFEAARPCLESGTQAAGSDQIYAFLYLGKLYAAAGENGYAVAAWDKYLELDPNSVNAQRVRPLVEQMRPRAEVVKLPLATASGPCQ